MSERMRMGRGRRDRRQKRGQVVFVTSRVIKGLPFVARYSVEKVLLGIMARAQSMYPVKVCAYVFMGNHYHMILTGQGCHFSPFMNYLQGNIALSMKRLIPGFYEGVFWEGRYKEQTLVTVEDVIAQMAYIYLNPVRARLVKKANQYPGLNSFRHLAEGKRSILTKWIPYRCLKALPVWHDRKEDLRLARGFLDKAKEFEGLTIDPFGWFSSFDEPLSAEEVTEQLLGYVSQEESKPGAKVLGVEALKARSTRTDYKPKTKTPTPYLICCDKELRIRAIQSYRHFCEQCREAWRLIKKGLKCVWPRGAYMPSMRSGWVLVT